MKAAIYCRVSTEEQVKGYSIASQLDELRSYCHRAGHSLDEAHVFVAAGESGASMGPTLKRLLACAKEQQFQILAVTNVDRFSRNPRLAFNILHDLEQSSIVFVSTDEDIDYSTDDGKVEATDRIADSFKERVRLRKRCRKGIDRAVRAGQYSGGIIPYGYKLNRETKKLEVDEEEATVVRMVFDLCVNEDLSTMDIAVRLNALGVPTRYEKDGRTFRRKGRRAKEHSAGVWRDTAINRMLHYTGYHGLWYYGKRGRKREDWIKGHMPPIITQQLFDKAQAQLAANLCFSPRRTRRQYLVRGLIKCGICGRTFRGSASGVKGGETRYYRCPARWTYRRLQPERCPSPTLRADEIEEVVWDDILEFVTQPHIILNQLQRRAPSIDEHIEDELQRVEGLLQDNYNAESRLLRLYAKDVNVTRKALDDELDKLHREKEQLEAHKSQLMAASAQRDLAAAQFSEAVALLASLRDRIETADFEAKRSAVMKLVESITVRTGENEILTVTITYRFVEPRADIFAAPYLLPAWPTMQTVDTEMQVERVLYLA